MAASSSTQKTGFSSGHIYAKVKDQKAFSFCDDDTEYVTRCSLCLCLFGKKWYDYLMVIQITPCLKSTPPLCKKCIKQIDNHEITSQEIRSKIKKSYRKTI